MKNPHPTRQSMMGIFFYEELRMTKDEMMRDLHYIIYYDNTGNWASINRLYKDVGSIDSRENSDKARAERNLEHSIYVFEDLHDDAPWNGDKELADYYRNVDEIITAIEVGQ